MREGWDALPGHETVVDYKPRLYHTTLPELSDLEVEVTVRLPDGRSYVTRESQEYVMKDGEAEYFEHEDVRFMLERVSNAMANHLQQ